MNVHASVERPMAARLANQRAVFRRDGAPGIVARRADLRRLKAALLRRRSALEVAVDRDFGHRSRHETAVMEIAATVNGIDYLIHRLARFMRPERRHVALTMQPGWARVEYQPLGVIGIVSPWNYPVLLALMPLATAIAAGNRAMLKPSEVTPATSAALMELISATFSPEQVAVVTGDAEVGAAFTSLAFDHLLFTGSTRVGRAVMRAASENLVPVTLELGGKSPTIVARGAVDARNVAAIVYGKLANAGQTCVAPDYALVHEDDRDAFVSAYRQAVAQLYPAGPDSDDYSSIINHRQYDRLEGLIEDAASAGAQIVTIGPTPTRTRTMAPVLVLGATGQMKIMQEEIFGPILPVLTYREIQGAIEIVNDAPRPLALYYFGPDDADRNEVLSRTTSGNVTINGTILHVAIDDLPFGGVGPSGLGAYHGVEGFRTMSHAKGVFEQGRWNLSTMVRPPFGRVADSVLGLLLRKPRD